MVLCAMSIPESVSDMSTGFSLAIKVIILIGFAPKLTRPYFNFNFIFLISQ